jgi:DNA-directed RNA polymerase specialized sigma24 family protein
VTADRSLLRQASGILSPDELAVWVAKHYRGLGRRSGSRVLNITEEQFRLRLDRANRKMDARGVDAA